MVALSKLIDRRVVVASRNPAKINAAAAAVKLCFSSTPSKIQGADSYSGVPDQPMGDEETLQGAINRINSIQQQHEQQQQLWQEQQFEQQQHRWPSDALFIAVEGGVLLRGDSDLHCFAWAAVKQASSGRVSTARSAEFLLPSSLSQLVLQQGMELGAADDRLFGRVDSGQGTGTIGHLTNNIITRACYYEHAIVMALIPFMNPELYPEYND